MFTLSSLTLNFPSHLLWRYYTAIWFQLQFGLFFGHQRDQRYYLSLLSHSCAWCFTSRDSLFWALGYWEAVKKIICFLLEMWDYTLNIVHSPSRKHSPDPAQLGHSLCVLDHAPRWNWVWKDFWGDARKVQRNMTPKDSRLHQACWLPVYRAAL